MKKTRKSVKKVKSRKTSTKPKSKEKYVAKKITVPPKVPPKVDVVKKPTKPEAPKTLASITPGRSRELQEISQQPPAQKLRYEDDDVDDIEDSDDDSREETIAKHIVDEKEAEIGGGQKRKIFFKTNRLKTIENFMSYLGCIFPHFRKSIFPVVILNFGIVLFSQSIKMFNELYKFDKKSKYDYFLPFSKLQPVDPYTSLFRKSEIGKGLRGNAPSMDLAIMFVAILSILLIGTRHKAIVMCCVFSLPFWILALTHVNGFYHMGLFAVEVIDQLLATVLRVILIESVPKYHRTFAFIIFQISTVLAQVLSNFVIVFLNFTTGTFFQFASVMTVGLAYHVSINIHDTLFNLLTNGEFNKLEKAFHRYITVAKLKLRAAVTVDHLAFEHYEINDDTFKVLRNTIRTLPVIYELFACSFVSGFCVIIYNHIDRELSESTKHGMSDKWLLSPASYSVAVLVMTVFVFILPRSRLVPITIATFLVLPAWALMQNALRYTPNDVPCLGTSHTKSMGAYIPAAIAAMGLTDTIRIFVHVHLLETMPSLIRVPAYAFSMFLEYAIDGTVRDFIPVSGESSTYSIYAILFLPISVWMLTPKKHFGLTMYFSEISTRMEKRKRLSHPPVVID